MLFLSIGENCMPQMLLKRFDIQNTWNTPFSYARSNIRYAIKYEQESYKTLLDNKYITKLDTSCFPNLYRNIKYINNTDYLLFEKSVSMGFEFTHHNIVDDLNSLESYKRKIQRMIDLQTSDENIVFLYHHRYLNTKPLNEIIEYCNIFTDFFNKKNRKCHIILLNQKIIEKNEKRKLVISNFKNCFLCDFYTQNIWCGDDGGFVSAEIDDDLFVDMFKKLYSMNLLDNINFIHNYHLSIYYFLQNEFDSMYTTIMNNVKLIDKQKFYIWGAGAIGIFLSKNILKRNTALTAIIDNDINKQLELNLPIPVVPFSAVEINSTILISIFNKNKINDIVQQIKNTNNEISITTFKYERFEFFCVTILGK